MNQSVRPKTFSWKAISLIAILFTASASWPPEAQSVWPFPRDGVTRFHRPYALPGKECPDTPRPSLVPGSPPIPPTSFPANDGFEGHRHHQTLHKNALVDRYGFPAGHYLSPVGTPFTQRAIPPDAVVKPYYVYRVKKRLRVESGKIAPFYGEPGGGRQYFLPDVTIEALVQQGVLKEENAACYPRPDY